MSMALGIRRCSLAIATAAMVSLAASAQAQEPSAEHLAAARAAINAISATDQFDAILPNAAQNLKTTLIQTAPNLQEVISVTVDETAIEMAGRRADLEREAAAIYAKNFSVEELSSIRTFYDSEAGKKLLETGPIVTRELLQAAEVWSNGISRDLTTATEAALRATLGETPTEAPTEESSTDTQ
ncbi:MAG: DUF2059 domain-containing protein [Hyphomicrobiales bacterium]|nr:DUF2059 domain-containing protein [Hyphomicrobiales bacterium]MCP4999670.1 DUF2059 domain-containing protein [Hyphomicrobiales bacterium]